MQEQPTEKTTTPKSNNTDFISRIVEKVDNAENILVALSRNPAAEEIAAAIGLTLFLDKMKKHATAIYSGETPESLQFLKPEETLETTTDSLQDFIIALNKDKADHLRYKIDGDFVKVFITPYKTTINEEDFEFSRGDYNVDLIIALNVPTANDLDAALTEHGRIMHDASAVDITIGEPGKFGEVEWSEPKASSVSEMVTNLVFALSDKNKETIDPSAATALLTGIISATDRFSNERTFPETMMAASRLMSVGANQKLIVTNFQEKKTIEPKKEVDEEVEEPETTTEIEKTPEPPKTDPSLLNITHGEEIQSPSPVEPTTPTAEQPTSSIAEPTPAPTPVEQTQVEQAPIEPTLSPPIEQTPPPAEQAPAGPPDYSKMMDEALAEPLPGIDVPNPLPSPNQQISPNTQPTQAPTPTIGNPAAAASPTIANVPVPNDLPEIKYEETGPILSTDIEEATPTDTTTSPDTGEDAAYIIDSPEKVLQAPTSENINLPPPPPPPTALNEVPPNVPNADINPTANIPTAPILPPVPENENGITSNPTDTTLTQPNQPSNTSTPDPSAFQIPGM